MERRKFTREFKLEAVRLIKDRGVSYVQASADLIRALMWDASACASKNSSLLKGWLLIENNFRLREHIMNTMRGSIGGRLGEATIS